MVEAARAGPSPFAPTVRGPFTTALCVQRRGIPFVEFALRCSVLDRNHTEIMVEAAAVTAWRLLRPGGQS